MVKSPKSQGQIRCWKLKSELVVGESVWKMRWNVVTCGGKSGVMVKFTMSDGEIDVGSWNLSWYLVKVYEKWGDMWWEVVTSQELWSNFRSWMVKSGDRMWKLKCYLLKWLDNWGGKRWEVVSCAEMSDVGWWDRCWKAKVEMSDGDLEWRAMCQLLAFVRWYEILVKK